MELDQLPPEEQAKFMRAFSGGEGNNVNQMQGPVGGPAWSGEFGQQQQRMGGGAGVQQQGRGEQEQQIRRGEGRVQIGGYNYSTTNFGPSARMAMGGMGMGAGMVGRSGMMGLAPGMATGYEQPRMMQKESQG